MRIHYVADSIVPSRTANSVHVMKMCASFARLGHEVTLIVRNLRAEELAVEDPHAFYGVPRNFALVKLDPWPLYARRATFAFQAARRARRERPDLVYTRSFAAALFSVHLGRTVIYESHTPEAGFAAPRLYPHLLGHPRLRRHIVITEALRRHYLERGIPAERLQVAPDGADAHSGIAPADLGDGRRCRVGYVGHLYPGRGIGLVLELARRVPEADFHLVGGTEQDLAHWREQAGGRANVVFHGFLPPAVLDAYRAAFDVVLAPYEKTVRIAGGGAHDSVRWMSPLKVFEYMAAGKAILASRHAVLAEVVEDGTTALLCDPENPDEWEAQLRALIADPERRARLGAAARRVFEAHYTWDRRAAAVLAGP